MLLFFRISPLLLVLLISCNSEYEDVELTEIRDLRVTGVKNATLNIKGNAVLYNPNKRGVRLLEAEINVYHRDKLVATINPSEKVKIKARSDFEIPVDIGVKLKGSGLLNNVLDLLGKRAITLEFRGYIKVRSWLIPGKIEVHQEQTINY